MDSSSIAARPAAATFIGSFILIKLIFASLIFLLLCALVLSLLLGTMVVFARLLRERARKKFRKQKRTDADSSELNVIQVASSGDDDPVPNQVEIQVVEKSPEEIEEEMRSASPGSSSFGLTAPAAAAAATTKIYVPHPDQIFHEQDDGVAAVVAAALGRGLSLKKNNPDESSPPSRYVLIKLSSFKQ